MAGSVIRDPVKQSPLHSITPSLVHRKTSFTSQKIIKECEQFSHLMTESLT